MLNKEFKYYIEHQDELVKKFNGKHIVIVGNEVMGSYETHAEAYTEAVKKFKLGTFLIQHCTPGPESYTTYIHSRRVAFV